MAPIRLLVIDDEPDVSAFVADVAQGLGYETATVDNPRDFWTQYAASPPSVVVLDLMMPEVDGVELLRALAEKKSRASIVLVSGADPRILSSAQRLGRSYGLHMLGALHKPMDVADLEALLGKVVAQARELTAEELKLAIGEGRLVVHYQPKANISLDRVWAITSCEALVRLNHPRFGLLPPDQFVPLAERTGLIDSLTDAVMVAALDQVQAWRQQGLDLGVAINIAPHTIADLGLPDRLHVMVAGRGIDPGQVTVEITESGAMADTTRTMDILTRFRLKGFDLSIDDFGTGYSSLVQLHRLPFNEMKIDKSFVMEIGRS